MNTQGSTIGAFVAVIVLYVLNTYVLPTPLNDAVSNAITGLVTILVGYFTPAQARPITGMFRRHK
jgi:ribose/xylose/arabinose/galactoside ABC-type transport system permease subunit